MMQSYDEGYMWDQIDQLERDLDKDEEYIAKLEEKNQRLEAENHRKDQTIQQYQDYIRELVQSVESQRVLIEKLQGERKQ